MTLLIDFTWGNLTMHPADHAHSSRLPRTLIGLCAAATIAITAAPAGAAPAPAPKPAPAAATAKPATAPAAVTPPPAPRMRVPVPGQIRDGEFADTSRELITRDGWKVTVSKFGEKLDSVPPLNRSPQSFEGFSSVGGEAKIEAAYPNDPKRKPSSKIKSATLTTGTQIGCAVTADSLTVGGSLSNATTASITPTVTASGTVTGQGQGGSNGGSGGGSVSGTGTGSLSGTLSDTVTETGSISGVLKPGTTKDIPYAKKAVVGPNAQVMSRDIRIAVDNCIGGVQVRTYATVAISTDATDDTLTTFGKPIFLTRPEQNR
ncbi:MspA family porin [Tsukamurella sp. DT100]|uniref:MspA family porin n=1 Tax=Tsukamurella sp. DT100 TaxID=3393415 RepID=UPI003CE6A842